MKKVYLLGGRGFVGSGIASAILENANYDLTVIDRSNYDDLIGTDCDIFINANGNSKKFLATQDPLLDFDLSVSSVYKSLYNFKYRKYVYMSSSEVYNDSSTPEFSYEDQYINADKLTKYGFHKFLSESIVRNTCDDWLIIRQSGFVGDGLKKNPIYDLLNGMPLWVNISSELQYINTKESGNLLLKLIELNIANEVYNISADGVVKLEQVASLCNSNSELSESAPVVRCEINIAKIKSLFNVPTSIETITNFLNTSDNN